MTLLVINPDHAFLLVLVVLSAYITFKRTERTNGQGDLVATATVGAAVAGVLVIFFGASPVGSVEESARSDRDVPSASAAPFR
ncbi:hypothetical protein ABTY59_33840 [Streptomyces sp. NPDC096079]|uniref:hypothetical protein n=1 Tax=Streptomyces sp. NPDC096079 TaxID=3155820 RepID=UPI003320FD06